MMAMVMTAMVMEMITSMVLMMLVADVGRLMKVMLARIAMLCAEVHVMVMPLLPSHVPRSIQYFWAHPLLIIIFPGIKYDFKFVFVEDVFSRVVAVDHSLFMRF